MTMMINKELNDQESIKIIDESIEDYVSNMNISKFLKEITESFSGKVYDIFKTKLSDVDVISKYFNEIRELRNIHIHHLGIGKDGYQRIAGYDKIDTFRGMVLKLVPILDEMVVLELKS